MSFQAYMNINNIAVPKFMKKLFVFFIIFSACDNPQALDQKNVFVEYVYSAQGINYTEITYIDSTGQRSVEKTNYFSRRWPYPVQFNYSINMNIDDVVEFSSMTKFYSDVTADVRVFLFVNGREVYSRYFQHETCKVDTLNLVYEKKLKELIN